MILGGVVEGHVQADPADDALAKLNELSRQSEQTTEAMHSAQLDFNNKLAVQQAADAKHATDVAAAESAKSQLATFQSSVLPPMYCAAANLSTDDWNVAN